MRLGFGWSLKPSLRNATHAVVSGIRAGAVVYIARLYRAPKTNCEFSLPRVHFETSPTNESGEYAELAELVLFILNRVSVELTRESQSNNSLTKDQFRVAVRLIHSACLVGTLLPELIKERSLRLPYSLPLARMYYERVLLAAYVLSDDGSAAKRAILYSAYRVFKDQVKFVSIGGQESTIRRKNRTSRKSPLVAEALKYFKNERRVEEYEHSRQERCAIISKRSREAGIHFEAVEQMGYSASSEVVHGSYLSTILFSDSPSGDTPEKSFEEITTEIMGILVLSSEALGRLLVDICPHLPTPPLLVLQLRILACFSMRDGGGDLMLASPSRPAPYEGGGEYGARQKA